jgi:hypothetical protein
MGEARALVMKVLDRASIRTPTDQSYETIITGVARDLEALDTNRDEAAAHSDRLDTDSIL